MIFARHNFGKTEWMDKKVKQRIALSTFFFLSGVSFSSWAARIPTIQEALGINEAELGTILLTMPVSSISGLPFSGWLIAKFDSRWPLFWGFIMHVSSLFLIGFSNTVVTLVAALFCFAFSMRILNIAMNTQAITLQGKFSTKINGSFHALWSIGGIAGVGFTSLMLHFNISIAHHFIYVTVFSLISTLIAFRFLLTGDRSDSGNKITFGKPNPHIMALGFLIFFASICEGGMFDWSGVYFKDVVKIEIFTLGYLVFMTCMALSRFASDWFIHKMGMPFVFTFSASLITVGMLMAVLMPSFWPAMIGFSLVGMGTASIIPMTFILAGTSKKYSPGMAISIIATYAMVGIMIGPPIMGYLAHAYGLQISFVFLAIMGAAIIPAANWFFKIRD